MYEQISSPMFSKKKPNTKNWQKTAEAGNKRCPLDKQEAGEKCQALQIA